MRRTIFHKLLLLGLMVGGASLATPLAPSAHAVDVWQGCNGGQSAVCGSKDDNAQDIMKNVINTILVVLGMIAVVMIVIGGIRYVTSNGDSSSVKSAKDTILYSVVGLAVAILAFAIVNFVIQGVSGQTGGGSGGGSSSSGASGGSGGGSNNASGGSGNSGTGTNGSSGNSSNGGSTGGSGSNSGGSGSNGGNGSNNGGTTTPTQPAAASTPAQFACDEYRLTNSAAYSACQQGYANSTTANYCATSYSTAAAATNKAGCEKGFAAAGPAKTACQSQTNNTRRNACQAGYIKSSDANFCSTQYASSNTSRTACAAGRTAATQST